MYVISGKKKKSINFSVFVSIVRYDMVGAINQPQSVDRPPNPKNILLFFASSHELISIMLEISIHNIHYSIYSSNQSTTIN